MRIAINKRLRTAASLVRDGAILADVGTDHAYLPIYLLEQGKIEKAILSDINEGPLNKARENVKKYGFEDKAEFFLCDGASALSGLGITDYTICGMGGELIADIIDKAPEIKNEKINLILQPMSKQEVLRRYLFENGFEINNEVYVTDECKHYVCILAHFSGKTQDFSDADVYFGKEKFFKNETEDFLNFMKAKLAALTVTVEGKMRGGLDTEFESGLLSTLKERLKIKQ